MWYKQHEILYGVHTDLYDNTKHRDHQYFSDFTLLKDPLTLHTQNSLFLIIPCNKRVLSLDE